MKRCVIIGAADIGDSAAAKGYIKPGDFVIYCDGGLRHRELLGAGPGLIVGDFDSYDDPRLPVETITLPREKDDTDTVFAVKEALRRGFDDFTLLGVTGGRLDHTLANVSILLRLDTLGKTAVAVDDFSEISVVSKEPAFVDDGFEYFSLLNVTGEADGITVTGAKWCLDGAEITCDYQYGVSNEPLPGRTAEIKVAHGRLLLVKVRRGS